MPNEQAVADQPKLVSDNDEFSQAWDNEEWAAPKEEPKAEEEKGGAPQETDQKSSEEETKEPEDDTKESKPPAEETPKTALEEAEDRARRFFKKDTTKQSDDGTESKPSDGDVPETGEEPATEAKKKELPPPKAQQIEDPVAHTKAIIDKLEEGDRKTRLNDLVEGYPEIAELAVLLGSSAPQAAPTSAKLPDGIQEKLDSYDKLVARVEAMESNEEGRADREAQRDYMDALEFEVPGARRIARSENFRTWIDEQSAGIQMLVDSGVPDDGVSVLKAYQEYEASQKARQHDTEVRETADTRKASLRSVGVSAKKSVGDKRGSDADDYDAGFDLEPPERYK
jgi:hypothetical protein